MKKFKLKIGLFLLLSGLSITIIHIIGPATIENKDEVSNFWIKKSHSKHQYDIVIGGDSRVYRGINPDSIVAQVNPSATAYNFAFSATGLSTAYIDFLAGKFIPESKQKILLLGITAYSLCPIAQENGHFNHYLKMDDKEVFSALKFAPITKYFPPYDMAQFLYDSTNTYLQKWHSNGFTESNNTKGDVELTFYLHWELFKTNKVSDTILSTLTNRLLELKKNGIEVYTFIPTVCPKMAEIETGSGFIRKDIQVHFNNLDIPCFDLPFDAFESYDCSHLKGESANRFSSMIGREIRKKQEKR